MHRARGVKIGEGCFIGTDVILETAFPHLIEIGNGVDIGMRTTVSPTSRARSPRRASPRW